MFVRGKRNKSGTTSVQIIDKSSGKYVLYQTVGKSRDEQEIAFLVSKGKKIIETLIGQTPIPFDSKKELEFVDTFVKSLSSMSLVGPELLLGQIFDSIGFNAITDNLFRHLVITRIVYPVSKLKTTDYLFKYKGIDLSVYSIYRYMDKLHQHQIEQVKNISLQHTIGLIGNKLSIVFYDVTTLYFEASKEDNLRKTGFSKDGKHQNPQIVLGLLASRNGYPLDYEVFEGNQYEGDTLLPIINHFKAKYLPESLIVVADSGLLSNKNIELLKEHPIYSEKTAFLNDFPLFLLERLQVGLNEGKTQIILQKPPLQHRKCPSCKKGTLKTVLLFDKRGPSENWKELLTSSKSDF